MKTLHDRRPECRRRRRIRLRLLSIDPFCWFCGRELGPENSTIDHFKARSVGGTEDEDNLVLACYRCNVRKGNIPAERFACHRRRGCSIVHVDRLPKARRPDG